MTTYNNLLNRKLESLYDQKFREAVELFQRGQVIESLERFNTCRTLARERLEPVLACAIVSNAMQNHSRSAWDLLQAFSRSQKLDELRFDWQKLYPDRIKFDAVVEKLNLAANKSEINPQADEAVILAYLAWLKGDYSIATSAAQTAANTAGEIKQEDRRKTIERFREMLKAAHAAP